MFLTCDAPPDNLGAVDASLFHYQYIHMVSGGRLPPTWLRPDRNAVRALQLLGLMPLTPSSS